MTNVCGPARIAGWGRCRVAWRFSLWSEAGRRSGAHAGGLLDDREAHACLVPVFFRHLAPAFFGFLASLERAFDLGGAFHELVEVHRTELAANHPEIAAFGHDTLLLFSRLNPDVGAVRLELRGFGGVVKRCGRRGAA